MEAGILAGPYTPVPSRSTFFPVLSFSLTFASPPLSVTCSDITSSERPFLMCPSLPLPTGLDTVAGWWEANPPTACCYITTVWNDLVYSVSPLLVVASLCCGMRSRVGGHEPSLSHLDQFPGSAQCLTRKVLDLPNGPTNKGMRGSLIPKPGPWSLTKSSPLGIFFTCDP